MYKQIAKAASVGFASTLALAVSANNVQALDFTFSFGNTAGNTAGTVEGTITGLNDNSTGAASSVLITSFPADLGGSFDNGNDATLWSDQSSNSFTVTNGSITAANFLATQSGTGLDGLCLAGCNSGTMSALTLDNQSTIVVNSDGFAGITFPAVAPTAVPFGVSADLSLIILGGLYGASRLRKFNMSK